MSTFIKTTIAAAIVLTSSLWGTSTLRSMAEDRCYGPAYSEAPACQLLDNAGR